jgi:hypothetical protein
MKLIKHDNLLIRGVDEDFFNVKIARSSTSFDYNLEKFVNVNHRKLI